MVYHVQLAELEVGELLIADVTGEDCDRVACFVNPCADFGMMGIPFTLHYGLITLFAVERIDFADAGKVVVLDAQMLLAVFQIGADCGADVARVARGFIVFGGRGNVMGKFLVSGHRFLTDITKEIRPEKTFKSFKQTEQLPSK